VFLNIPTLGWFVVFGEYGLVDFSRVDSVGHCNQGQCILEVDFLEVDFCLEHAECVYVIVSEPKRIPYV